MSGVSIPVLRPSGRALVVGGEACRAKPVQLLHRLGYVCGEADDPYAAMMELCRRPLVYRAVILSLTSLYREELPMIEAIKHRYPHLDIWLTQTDGRQASLAEAMRLGADGLLSDDGLHRVAFSGIAPSGRPGAVPLLPPQLAGSPMSMAPADAGSKASPRGDRDAEGRDDFSLDGNTGEPVLTAEELRALLQEQPIIPPGEV